MRKHNKMDYVDSALMAYEISSDLMELIYNLRFCRNWSIGANTQKDLGFK